MSAHLPLLLSFIRDYGIMEGINVLQLIILLLIWINQRRMARHVDGFSWVGLRGMLRGNGRHEG